MNCTIIISHFESLPFLHACIRQIRKYKHPEVEQHIIIADQSYRHYHGDVIHEFGNDEDVTIVWMKPLYSGYGIDYILRKIIIDTKYICQIHVDAFPIHKNWLYTSIKLLEENTYSFVGQHHFTSYGNESIYPPGKPFFSMSPTFNVARTHTYKQMSIEAGFNRFHERQKAAFIYNNNDWAEWAKGDYWNRGSDDDVPAFHWEGNNRETNKLAYAINGIMGLPGEESGYGRIIDDLVFHFGFCRESIGVGEGMGKRYCDWTTRINEGFTDELIEEMLIISRANHSGSKDRLVWDGKLRQIFQAQHSINLRIEELKSL